MIRLVFFTQETRSLHITLIFFLLVMLRIISMESKHVCTIYAWIVHRWFVNRWIACIVNLHNPVMQVYLYGERSDAAVRCVRTEMYQMQPILFKTGVPKNFAIFTEKRLCLKRDTKQVLFCEYCEIFKLFLKNTSGGCIWCILNTGLTSAQKGWRLKAS